MGHLMCLFLRCVQISRSRMKGQHAAGLALLILSSCAIQGYSLPQNRWVLSSLVKQRFFNNCAGIQQRSMQGSLVPLQQRKTLPMTLTTRSRLPRRRGACFPYPRRTWWAPPHSELLVTRQIYIHFQRAQPHSAVAAWRRRTWRPYKAWATGAKSGQTPTPPSLSPTALERKCKERRWRRTAVARWCHVL